MTKDHEHLQWIYDRLVNFHQEDENLDYMQRLHQIILGMRRADILDLSARIAADNAELSRLNAESLRQRVPPVKP